MGTHTPNGLETAKREYAGANSGQACATVLGPRPCGSVGVERVCSAETGTAASPVLRAKGIQLGRSDSLRPALAMEGCARCGVLERPCSACNLCLRDSLQGTASSRLFGRWMRTIHGIRTGGIKGGRRSGISQAPPLLRQRKPYLTGSPPSRRESRCRQEYRVVRVYRGIVEMLEEAFP